MLAETASFEVTAVGEAELIARFTPQPCAPGSGDVDASGDVTIADALLIMRASMGLLALTDEQLAAGNLDGDGEITIADALLVMRVSMGLL